MGLKDRRVREKNRKIRDGIEDMSGIDGMIMVKLGHEGKMKGFSEGERKGGQATQDGGKDCGHTRPRRYERDWDLTLRGNVTRWMGLDGKRGI